MSDANRGGVDRVVLLSQTLGGTIGTIQADRSAIVIPQAVETGGSPSAFVINAGAHTTLAAGVEASDVNINITRTVQFASGAIAQQRAIRIGQPTYAFVAPASVIAEASTVSIAGPPLAGLNATITAPFTLDVATGNVKIGSGGIVQTELAAVPAAAVATRGTWWVRNDAPNVPMFTDDAGTDWQLAGIGGGNTLDQAYDAGGAGAGRTITADAGAVIITSAAADNNIVLSLVKAPAGAQAGSGFVISMNANTTDHGFVVNQTGSGAAGHFRMNGAIAGAQGVIFTETAFARTAAMLELTRDAAAVAATAHVIEITNAGGGDSIHINSGNTIFNATQSIVTTGSPSAFVLTGGAHTTLAAGVEAVDVNFNLARTVQFATGPIATQRAFRIQAPTWDFVGASVVTDAITLDVAPPVAGGAATFTNTWAIRSTGAIGIPDGTAAVPAIALSSDPDTGIFGTATILSFSTAGTERARVQSTGIRVQGTGLAAAPSISKITDSDTGITWGGANELDLVAGSAVIVAIENPGVTITPAVQTSGTPVAFTITGAAHTSLTNANTPDIDFDLSATMQLDGGGGAIATMNTVQIEARTYSAAAAQVIDDATSFYVNAAPTAGPNVTITRGWAMRLGGDLGMEGNIVDLSIAGDKAEYIYSDVDTQIRMYCNTGNVQTWNSTNVAIYRETDIAPNVKSSGTWYALTITGAAHTSLTNADNPDVEFDSSATLQFDGGGAAIAAVRTVKFLARTYSAAAAQVITDATSFYIDAAPSTGPNMTITRAWAAWVDAGDVRIDDKLSVGVGAASPAAQLDVKQGSTTGAIEVVKMEQADVDVSFMHFVGTAAAGDLTRSLVDFGDEAGSTGQVWIKVFVTDDGNQVPDDSYFLLGYRLT